MSNREGGSKETGAETRPILSLETLGSSDNGRTLDQALRTPEHDQSDRQGEGKQPGYGVAELAYRPSTQDVREVGCHATDDGF